MNSVPEIQIGLNALGFGPLDVDGDYGPKTWAAVRSFQRAYGLKDDGIWGPRSSQAFTDALAGVREPENTGALIDPDKWAAWCPRAVPNAREAMEKAARDHGLTERLVLAHWLGQNHHESVGFSRLVENLNYSAKRLTQVWPSRFRTLAAAQPFANNPEALANNVYGGRMGNIKPGDGWLFRGRGFKMLTGRYNYTKYRLHERPDDLLDPFVSADVSARFFVDAGCVPLARNDDIEGVTRRINGGLIGLADRRVQTARAKTVLLKS